MRVDWRALLTSIRVPWIDKGRNVGRGNINITCPWCANDPSYHLGIAEGKEAYYCYREPNRHSGTNFIRLLLALGINRIEGARLLTYYGRKSEPIVIEEKVVDADKVQRGWDRFAPATNSERCLNYLASRGFPHPRIAAEQYDLRYAVNGEWANRLLFPLSRNNQMIAWTGRALLASAELRYKTYAENGLQTVYSPDSSKPTANVLIIVEGPLDALKVAYACHRLPYRVAALAGKQLSSEKLLQLREMGAGCDLVVALDADVPMSSAYQIMNELAQAIKPRRTIRARLPLGYGDPGELPVEDVQKWLTGCVSGLS